MQMSPADANMAARGMVLGQAINMVQSIATGTLTGASARGSVVNVPIRNVGLLKRFWLELSCTIIQSAAETQTLTKWGPANFCSQIIFTDLNNQNRINTSGWHLHALATARRQMAYGAAFTNDSPVSIGSNFNVMIATASVTNSAKTIRMFYEIPIAYGDYDLRGAIFANVVNATMNLQFTVNPNFVVGSGADATLAVYQSSTAGDLGTLGTVTWTLYQNYLDQLPQGKNGPIVPQLDLSTAYDIKNTAIVGGLAVGQETPIPYANFRNFMSTTVIYDNGGTLNVGTDVNYWSLQSANYTNIFKIDPFLSSLMTRQLIGDDMPPGTYYFDHRAKPISTIQYGNMQLVLNPSTVNANAQMLVGFEALALINQITQAGSLYAT
jgi:hypothetical protein